MKCERCGKETSIFKCSMFNTESICTECTVEEEAHPQYEEARDAEAEACKRGDYNYPGIGLPDDLKKR